MNTITAIETKVVTDAVLGTIAFNAGQQRVPALDPELNQLLVGQQVGEGIPILKAWLTSWDAANLVANLPAK